MSFKYGFYNSINHDRRYDAVDMSSIFDGIINDGVFMSEGEKFMVKENEGLFVTVGTGRAWFNHTWSLNTSSMLIEVEPGEPILNRIDIIVLEVDSSEQTRANSIRWIKGTPASQPVMPTLVNTELVHQHLLASIYMAKGAESVRQADITNYVGTEQTPFVTGILETMDIDALIAQWKDQWERQTELLDEWTEKEKQDFLAWKNEEEAIWMDWFEHLKYVLDGDVAGHLQLEIEELQNFDRRLVMLPISEDGVADYGEEGMFAVSDGKGGIWWARKPRIVISNIPDFYLGKPVNCVNKYDGTRYEDVYTGRDIEFNVDFGVWDVYFGSISEGRIIFVNRYEEYPIIMPDLNFNATWADGTVDDLVQMVHAYHNGWIPLTDVWHVGDERVMHLGPIPGDSCVDDQPEQDIVFRIIDTSYLQTDGSARITPFYYGKSFIQLPSCRFVVEQKNCFAEKGKFNHNTSDEGELNWRWYPNGLEKWLNTVFKNNLGRFSNIFKPITDVFEDKIYFVPFDNTYQMTSGQRQAFKYYDYEDYQTRRIRTNGTTNVSYSLKEFGSASSSGVYRYITLVKSDGTLNTTQTGPTSKYYFTYYGII